MRNSIVESEPRTELISVIAKSRASVVLCDPERSALPRSNSRKLEYILGVLVCSSHSRTALDKLSLSHLECSLLMNNFWSCVEYAVDYLISLLQRIHTAEGALFKQADVPLMQSPSLGWPQEWSSLSCSHQSLIKAPFTALTSLLHANHATHWCSQDHFQGSVLYTTCLRVKV